MLRALPLLVLLLPSLPAWAQEEAEELMELDPQQEAFATLAVEGFELVRSEGYGAAEVHLFRNDSGALRIIDTRGRQIAVPALQRYALDRGTLVLKELILTGPGGPALRVEVIDHLRGRVASLLLARLGCGWATRAQTAAVDGRRAYIEVHASGIGLRAARLQLPEGSYFARRGVAPSGPVFVPQS